ncbi:Ig-like domain-containing protein [Lactococcus lactis]|uniref:Ig-like domain-containing protein n=1 Tax=Lactococcus lactis TaxID=1358 RepID=UPI00101066E6|nr:Ig-like domain-containing protein [Lactococcus lactis]RXS51109.1 major capsid protein [Lactococcus lactis]
MKNKKLKFNLQRFGGDVVTFLNSQVDPEVMGQMVAAQLPKAIKFSGIAPIDTTLAGQPGSTITLPKFKYSGDAKVVAEGAAIQMDELQTATQTATIKKVAKGMAITDEAVLSGYGDPVGEIQRQIRMAIASAVDNEIVAVAGTANLTVVADVNLDLIDKLENTFVEAPDALEEQGFTQGVLFVSYKDAATLRQAAGVNWTHASELGDNILVSGAFGEVLGWTIVRSKKINDGSPIAVKPGAMKTFLKRDVLVEFDREITKKVTQFTGDEHYVVAIVDETKIVRVQAAPISVTGVTISQKTASMKVGATKELSATIAPDNATNKAVTYSSSAEAVATVNADGKVTAVAEGTANITVTTTDGSKTDVCAVTVTA